MPPARNAKDSRRAAKLRAAAEKRARDRAAVLGAPDHRSDASLEDVRHGWIPAVAEAAGLEFDGLVYWGSGAAQRQTGIKYLDFAFDPWKGHLVVFYFTGHVWSDLRSTFMPHVGDYSPEADLPCCTLRQACVLNHEFETQGFSAV